MPTAVKEVTLERSLTQCVFLQVGTTLTGVGELILDTDRALKLRPPTDGSEYFLTTADFETLRIDQENQAAAWQALAAAFALAGAAVLLWVARRYYRSLKHHWEQERLRREFETLGADSASPPGPGTSRDEAAAPLENACVICLSRPRGCVLLDCGHVCCCYRCYQALPQATCPICRQTIRRVVPLYQA